MNASRDDDFVGGVETVGASLTRVTRARTTRSNAATLFTVPTPAVGLPQQQTRQTYLGLATANNGPFVPKTNDGAANANPKLTVWVLLARY